MTKSVQFQIGAGLSGYGAELRSAFVNAELGFAATTIPSHAGYIETWLKILKNDKRAIFTAASAASHAHPYTSWTWSREKRC